jgi:hypothetical protein
MRENIWFLAFWAWLTSLKMIFSSYIHLLTNDKISSSSWLSKIPLCINTTFSESICQLWGILVVSITWLLWIVLQWTWVCRCLWSNLSRIPLGISLGVGLLDHIAELCLVFYDSPSTLMQCHFKKTDKGKGFQNQGGVDCVECWQD